MKKPLAGRRWFEALGQRDQARGYPYAFRYAAAWPQWALDAWRRGWMRG